MQERGLAISDTSKLSVLTCDLSHSKLGLEASTYEFLLSRTSCIIHCAWPVNFQLALNSFEPQIQSLHNLLQLSLGVRLSSPAQFLFCSSVSVALHTPPPARIPEATIEDLSHASDTGYAQSKLVGEHIMKAAVNEAGARGHILRIGQVVGDTKKGVWNDNEAFPLIVRSGLTMGILPELPLSCEWLPVDTLATAVIEITGIPRLSGLPRSPPPFVYNLRSPCTFSWTSNFLPALFSAGLSFRPVPTKIWLNQLRDCSDPKRTPAIKLVDFFEATFTTGKEKDDIAEDRIVFDISSAEDASPALRNASNVVESGLVEKMVRVWIEKWKREDEL